MEPTIVRVTPALTTHRIALPLSHAIPIKVGIDTHAEVDLVDIKLVQQLGLKPCQNKNLPILRAINQQNLPTMEPTTFALSLQMPMESVRLPYDLTWLSTVTHMILRYY